MNKKTSQVGTHLSVLLLAVALPGCTPNLLQNIEFALGQSQALDHVLMYYVNGSGTCQGNITIDWGDGVTEVTGYCPASIDATGQRRFQCEMSHVYSGWGGGKTVTATAISGCEGQARLRLNFPPATTIIPFVRPGPNVCDAVPGRPVLANRTLVKITTIPNNTRCGGIYYKDANPHCYDAEGGVASLPPPPAGAPAPVFPFPNMRQFSLVLRVGTQVVQGGTNMSFITNQSGALELCVNEPDSTAGSGGYEVHIETDQLGIP